MTLPLFVDLLLTFHIYVLSPYSRPSPNVVFRVLRNNMPSPGYMALQHGRLIRTCGVSALRDELVFGS